MKLKKINHLSFGNDDFLKIIYNSFCQFLKSGSSRSTKKLEPLHGAIAADLKKTLGDDYNVHSKGLGDGKEYEIKGRYMNKMVDITITDKKDKTIAGIAVKFVMQNYSQNSNNYFENMLGETANIRSNNYPYFQIFIILDRLPYYDKTKKITKWESLTKHNLDKYIALSKDNPDKYYHTPNKTLLYIIHIPQNDKLKTKEEYLNYYLKEDFEISLSKFEYKTGNSLIVNDYLRFMNKVYHTIKAI